MKGAAVAHASDGTTECVKRVRVGDASSHSSSTGVGGLMRSSTKSSVIEKQRSEVRGHDTRAYVSKETGSVVNACEFWSSRNSLDYFPDSSLAHYTLDLPLVIDLNMKVRKCPS